MKRSVSMAVLLLLVTIFGTGPSAQEATPREAFKAVHLVTFTPADVTAFLSAIADINAILARAGHPDIRYRLHKVVGKQSGDHAYMWESSWPSGAVYGEIHKDPAFLTAIQKHPVIDRSRKSEVYTVMWK